MVYRQYPFRGFGGGLNLRDGVDVVAEDQAIDAINVRFNTRGTVSTRPGFRRFAAVEGTNRYDSLSAYYKSDGTKQLLAGAGNRLEGISAAGAIVASTAAPTANPHFFQRFGGPTREVIYAVNGVDNMRMWDGAAFSTPVIAGTPTIDARFLGLSSTDARLVAARFNGSTAGDNPSTVRFSMEGDPHTFTASHYEDLTPGDGEPIMGVASWRNLVVVFKQSKFFVFYGQGVDDEGEPSFNYRAVEAGVGLVASRGLAVAEEGIYFLDRSGIYFTDGNEPQQVSEAVQPIFDGTSSIYYLGGDFNHAAVTQATMVKYDDMLLLSFPADGSSVNNRQLVFDLHNKWWSLYDLPAGPMAVFRPGDADELIFGHSSGLKQLGRFYESNDFADDILADGTGGTAITARWQSGWFDYSANLIKTIRELKIAGTGLVEVAVFRDYKQATPHRKVIPLSGESDLYDSGVTYDSGLLYGPSGIIQARSMRRAVRGETFSVGFYTETFARPFSIHRLVTHVREARVPSVARMS